MAGSSCSQKAPYLDETLTSCSISLYRFKLKMEGIYMGQPVYFQPCMTTPDQERQRLQCLPLHCVIEELIAAKARLEVEKSATMKCFEVFHQDRMRHVRMQAIT